MARSVRRRRSEKTVDDMVKTYGHSADERRLDDIDAHFGRQA